MVMSLTILGTFYVPEGESRTVKFPALRDGNDESQILIVNDRGTLGAPVYVDEADHDGLLMLKQYNAGELVGSLRMMARNDWLDPGDVVEIERMDSGTLDVQKLDDPEDVADFMS